MLSVLKIAVPWLLVGLMVEGSLGSTRFLTRTNYSASDLFKTKNDNLRISQEPIAVTRNPFERDAIDDGQGDTKFQRRNLHEESSTFNPDVLNKFLEDYATKIKSTTEKNYKYPFTVVKQPVESLRLNVREPSADQSMRNGAGYKNASMERAEEDDEEPEHPRGSDKANDTLERNKQWSDSPYDDRTGWVTLEAVPWSKSKISKWQANQGTQKPWPEHKPWDKPQGGDNSWMERPTYEDEVTPWYEKPKPNWPESPTINKKPWYESERPKPNNKPSRPSYFEGNDYDTRPSYAQKWPPEKPWDKFPDSHKDDSDIITDDRPSDFPSNWEKPQISKPAYGFDRFPSSGGDRDQNKNDWMMNSYNFPSEYDSMNAGRPSHFSKPSSSLDRPHFSHYQYSTDHPPSHPSTGDGQWVLLSTNRGYLKSRQRSIKISSPPIGNAEGDALPNVSPVKKNDENLEPVPVMSSRRQVRLTVLPSVNGTNTTTSHGGLLEVERTFKTVDQSQREYERKKQATVPTSFLTKRPIRNTGGGQPSNAAVLAAVGAGMLPATMAMMIPMVLGRRRRSSKTDDSINALKKSSIFELNRDFIENTNEQRKLRKLLM